MSNWDLLLEKLGIAQKFTDAVQNQREYVADEQTLRKMVNCLGFKLAKTSDGSDLLEKLNKKRWCYVLEPIYVVRIAKPAFTAVILKQDMEKLQVKISKNSKTIKAEYSCQILEERNIGKSTYVLLEIVFRNTFAPDYYDVSVVSNGNSYQTIMAVSPDECYVPQSIEDGRLWGFAIQLYALKSKKNWGVGDFSDLAEFVKICSLHGADVIGINPLNVLSHDYPENSSPYSSISRLFLNPIYIDVEKVKGFDTAMLSADDKDIIQKLQSAEYIDYPKVYNLKMKVLRQIFTQKFDVEDKDFKDFCQHYDKELDALAKYQAIYSCLHEKCIRGWADWPQDLQNPDSKAVADFAQLHQQEILFFKFLQYLAFKQFENVCEYIKKYGLKLGLYRDLPVGLSKDSAEVWQQKDLFIDKCGAGAPPDIFFPSGQRWCLGAFNPFKLKEQAYRPFIKILRSAMQGSGALRIDHVMSLMRLYIIPDDSDNGTYIYYNFDDMLGLVALESYLQKCMIVGESIGNVPDGFIEKLHERGIYSLSVLWAERWQNGAGCFKMPQDFPQRAFCSVGTHDMAPLKARWFGYDIATMHNLKMISDADCRNQYKAREDERRYLLSALDYANVWPSDLPRQGNCLYGEGYPNGIMLAVEKYMGMAAGKVYLAQLEDIFGETRLQNLPGTDRDRHPNWCAKISYCLEDFAQNNDFLRACKAINEGHK